MSDAGGIPDCLAGGQWAGPSLGLKTSAALLLNLADELGQAKPSQNVMVNLLKYKGAAGAERYLKEYEPAVRPIMAGSTS